MTEASVRDPKALRALSHPFRWKLLNLLTEEGAQTATQCSDRLDESVASCSYHLNMLAKYGFVEEVAGPGRQKPWRVASRERITPDGLDPEGAMAAEAAALAYLDQEYERLRERMLARKLLADDWRESVGMNSSTKFLTAEEAVAYKNEFEALLSKYGDRADDPSLRPEGSRAVRFFLGVTVAPEYQSK